MKSGTFGVSGRAFQPLSQLFPKNLIYLPKDTHCRMFESVWPGGHPTPYNAFALDATVLRPGCSDYVLAWPHPTQRK